MFRWASATNRVARTGNPFLDSERVEKYKRIAERLEGIEPRLAFIDKR